MQRTKLAAAVGFACAILVIGALSGCAAKVTGATSASKSHAGSGSIAHPGITATPKATATATPTATPSPSGPAPLPANALFRISATVTAANGATADLMQIVYKPISANASDTALLNSQCNYPGVPDFQGQPTWQSQVPNPVFLTSDFTATLRPGSPAFDNTNDSVYFGMPGAPGAYSGSYGIFEAYCDSGYIKVPGTIHGVAPMVSSDPVHGASGLYGWAAKGGASYGFAGGANSPDSPDTGGTALVKNCMVQVSAQAIAADPTIGTWTSSSYVPVDGCIYLP